MLATPLSWQKVSQFVTCIYTSGIMVKGKQQTKIVQAKKSNSVPQTRHETASGTSPSTSSSSSRKAKVSSPSVLCCGCNKPVTEDVKALQCDRCLGEEWKCVQCLGLSVEVYDQLVADPKCSLCWFCDGCEKMVMNASSKVENQYGDNDLDKIDKLVSLVEKLVQKLSDVDEKLNSKCDVKAVQQIEQRVKNIEKRVCKGETDLERRLASIDEHVSGFINDKIKSLGESRTTDSSALCVEQVVKEELGKNWTKTRILKLVETTLSCTGYLRIRWTVSVRERTRILNSSLTYSTKCSR